MNWEQLIWETCLWRSSRSRPAPSRSVNQSFLRSRVTVLFPKRAVLLNCRSSSTQGPMSLPSNWKWIETSESPVTEILSTGDISSEDSFARASETPQTTAQEEKGYVIA